MGSANSPQKARKRHFVNPRESKARKRRFVIPRESSVRIPSSQHRFGLSRARTLPGRVFEVYIHPMLSKHRQHRFDSIGSDFREPELQLPRKRALHKHVPPPLCAAPTARDTFAPAERGPPWAAHGNTRLVSVAPGGLREEACKEREDGRAG